MYYNINIYVCVFRILQYTAILPEMMSNAIEIRP